MYLNCGEHFLRQSRRWRSYQLKQHPAPSQWKFWALVSTAVARTKSRKFSSAGLINQRPWRHGRTVTSCNTIIQKLQLGDKLVLKKGRLLRPSLQPLPHQPTPAVRPKRRTDEPASPASGTEAQNGRPSYLSQRGGPDRGRQKRDTGGGGSHSRSLSSLYPMNPRSKNLQFLCTPPVIELNYLVGA